MKIISVQYFQKGTKIGKSGRVIKVFEKRLTLLCPACGETVIRSSGFWAAKSKSCGCIQYESITTHGMSHTAIYEVWHGMRTRCLNKKDKNYPRYGGRGIKICKRWNSFAAFLKWAMKAGWRKGLLLDRENNNGNYHPANCRFVTHKESNRNKSNVRINATTARLIKAELQTKTNRQLADQFNTTMGVIKNLRNGNCWKDE